MRWFTILYESLQSAYRTIILNKLRTFLSLLGVTIGIFSIVSVFSVVDSMKSGLEATVEAIGNDVIVVQKWPWMPESGTEFAWWEYLNRPVTTLHEFETLKSRVRGLKTACFTAAIQTDVLYLDNLAENLQLWGVTREFGEIRSFDMARGRFLSPFEISSGKNNCIIGYSIAEELFQGLDPLGRTIVMKGFKTTVVGVFAREGKSLIAGGSMDEVVLVPVNFLSRMTDLKSDRSSPQIWVKPNKGVSSNELIEELRMNMRSIRKLNPRTKDNFALNETVLMSTSIDQIFKIVNIAGWFIGIFSVLVGAFGIANIMFVSVKERTSVIGIQKALGAKNSYIIFEVLYESVLLSLIGGLLGLLLVYLGTIIARAQEFEILLSFGNIFLGLFVSTTVGLVAGLVPAFSAARLDPVKAIASTF